jgi:Fe-S cluster assembly ATPase SufC
VNLKIDVKKSFPTFAIDMSFTASQNHTGIFGPSGSGKSSLVNMIAGLVHPDEGLISFDGETLFAAGKINVPPHRRRMGIIFQRPNLFPHLDVKANLLYGYKRRQTRQSEVEVVDRSGTNSYLFDSGVLIERVWGTTNVGHSVIMSHLNDTGLTDFFVGGETYYWPAGHAQQITTGAMLCFFILLQSVILRYRKR